MKLTDAETVVRAQIHASGRGKAEVSAKNA